MKEEVYAESTVLNPAASLVRRVSWGAIFAGLVVTIVIQLTLTLLGVAIGAATIDPLRERNPAEGLGVSSAIWLTVSALISIVPSFGAENRITVQFPNAGRRESPSPCRWW